MISQILTIIILLLIIYFIIYLWRLPGGRKKKIFPKRTTPEL